MGGAEQNGLENCWYFHPKKAMIPKLMGICEPCLKNNNHTENTLVRLSAAAGRAGFSSPKFQYYSEKITHIDFA